MSFFQKIAEYATKAKDKVLHNAVPRTGVLTVVPAAVATSILYATNVAPELTGIIAVGAAGAGAVTSYIISKVEKYRLANAVKSDLTKLLEDTEALKQYGINPKEFVNTFVYSNSCKDCNFSKGESIDYKLKESDSEWAIAQKKDKVKAKASEAKCGAMGDYFVKKMNADAYNINHKPDGTKKTGHLGTGDKPVARFYADFENVETYLTKKGVKDKKIKQIIDDLVRLQYTPCMMKFSSEDDFSDKKVTYMQAGKLAGEKSKKHMTQKTFANSPRLKFADEPKDYSMDNTMSIKKKYNDVIRVQKTVNDAADDLGELIDNNVPDSYRKAQRPQRTAEEDFEEGLEEDNQPEEHEAEEPEAEPKKDSFEANDIELENQWA